ncbi:expressed unknown protein [Seminavis robusta]|uniref:DUF4149 domain-containing protein n=1 Tax=Seminavis robusta TaxID=568900 RepID=A0A9N8DN57_9STRA|nr:expressed unknown protein [Seminavis robusta]|eukprot:Sro148_g068030.1 n/a (197) ;mRNA; r:6615-7205
MNKSRRNPVMASLVLATALLPKVAHAAGSSASSAAASSLMRTTGLFANSALIGIPIWVFFLQAPLLFKMMGRDKFLFPMMSLTRLLFRWTLPVFSALSVACSVLLDCAESSCQVSSATKAALLTLAAILINSIVIVPKALQAGKMNTKKEDKSETVTDFAVSGGSKTNTKTLHQTVVVFVLIHVVGAVLHLHTATS